MWYRDASQGWSAFCIVVVFLADGLISRTVGAETLLIPSISATETYDSNVFWAPKTTLAPGTKPEDFMTTIIPQINLAHADPLIRGGLSASALITRYINNPDLDYTGFNVAGTLDAKGWAAKLSQRITTLTVTGTYQYTPFSGAFGANPAGGFGTGYGNTPLNPGQSGIGLVTNRVSMNMYTLGLNGGYLLTRTTTLSAGYTYMRTSFGGQSGDLNNPLFDTTGQTATTSLTTKLSARDNVGTTASLSHYEQAQSSGGGSGSFTTVSAMGNWSRMWTQRLNSSLSGGTIITLPIDSTVPGQSVKTQVAPTVSANLSYTTFSEQLRVAGASVSGPFDEIPALAGSLQAGTIAAPGQFTTAFTYNFSVWPSFAYGAGPTQAHVVGANIYGGITPKLTGQMGLNYARGSISTPESKYDSFGYTAGVRYLIGPVLATLTYNWLYFSNASTSVPQVQSEYAFSKTMVMLGLTYAFRGPAFYRAGGFGDWGLPGSREGGATPASAGSTTSPAGGGGAGVLK